MQEAIAFTIYNRHLIHFINDLRNISVELVFLYPTGEMVTQVISLLLMQQKQRMVLPDSQMPIVKLQPHRNSQWSVSQ